MGYGRRLCSDRRLVELLNRIYEAALDPTLWSGVLDALAEAIGSEATELVEHDYATRRGRLVALARLDESFRRKYEQHFAGVNIWKNRNRERYVQGAVLTSEQLATDADLLRSEWYHDFLRPMNIYYSMGAVLRSEGSVTATLSTMRPNRMGPYEQEPRIFQLLGPHVGRALRIQRLVGESAAGFEALNTIPYGVVLLSLGLRLVYANDLARRMCASRDGLLLERERLTAASRRDNAVLSSLLTTAAQAAAGQRLTARDCAALSRPSGLTPLQVFVAPVRLRCLLDPYAPAVLVVISDHQPEPFDPTTLTRLFGLSRQEARLLAALTSGKELAAAADQLRIRYETARKHLRGIFDKTATHRQSELMRLVLAGVARLRVSHDIVIAGRPLS
jgi:DNA-binding CsgD family transcriptional regulator